MKELIMKMFPKSYPIILDDVICIDLKKEKLKKKEMFVIYKNGLMLKEKLKKNILVFCDNLEIMIDDNIDIDNLVTKQISNVIVAERIVKKEKADNFQKKFVENPDLKEKINRLKYCYKYFNDLEKSEVLSSIANKYFDKDYLIRNLYQYRIEKVKILSK